MMRRGLPVLALLLALGLYARFTDAGQTIPGKGWQHIATVDLTGSASYTFDSSNGLGGAYGRYRLTLENALPSTDGENVAIRVNGNSGFNYTRRGSEFTNGVLSSLNQNNAKGLAVAGVGAGGLPAEPGMYATVEMVDMGGSTYPTAFTTMHWANNSADPRMIVSTSKLAVAAAVTSLSAEVDSGTFASGTLTIEGYVR